MKVIIEATQQDLPTRAVNYPIFISCLKRSVRRRLGLTPRDIVEIRILEEDQKP